MPSYEVINIQNKDTSGYFIKRHNVPPFIQQYLYIVHAFHNGKI